MAEDPIRRLERLRLAARLRLLLRRSGGPYGCHAYIDNQEEHHRARTFQDEYRAFLKKYEVTYDEAYVWD